MRHLREIVVRVEDRKKSEEVKTRSTEQILGAIKAISPSHREAIVSARRLPSGDIALHTAEPQIRMKMEKEKEWLSQMGESTLSQMGESTLRTVDSGRRGGRLRGRGYSTPDGRIHPTYGGFRTPVRQATRARVFCISGVGWIQPIPYG